MENNNDSHEVLSFEDFVLKGRMMDEACRQWCAFIDEIPGRRDGLLFTEFFNNICHDKYEEYLNDPSYREEFNNLAEMTDEERYHSTLKSARLADKMPGELPPILRSRGQHTLHLLYSCNEWCEKSKAALLLVTSDKETLYAAIGGEILTGNMEYDGETGGNGFANYKWDYLNHNVEMSKLNYGFVNEMDDALLSEPDTLPEYYKTASEFLDVYFEFDAAEFDKAYNSEDESEVDPDDENDMEI